MTVPSWLAAATAIAAMFLIVVAVVALFRVKDDNEGEHSLSLGLFKITSPSQAGLFLGAGVLLLALVVLGPQILDGGSGSTDSSDTESTTAGDEGTQPVEDTTLPEDGGGSDATDAERSDAEGCTVTIVNPFAAILETPEPLGQEIRSVPGGTYPVLEVETVSFAGADQRYLRIRVESDEGWIEDNTILIESHSEDCDF